MRTLATRWRLAVLFAPAAVLLALALGSALPAPTTDAAGGTLPKGVTCTHFFLDLDNNGVADSGTAASQVTAIAISRLDSPSQAGGAGADDYDLTSVLYLGPDTEADAEGLIPNEPPDQDCASARTEGTGSAEVSNINSRTLLVNQFGNRPGHPVVSFNTGTKVLTVRSCGYSEALGTWIRQDSFTTIASTGPSATNSVDAVLYLATSAPSSTVAGEPNIADDPTTCSVTGAFAYNTVGVSHGRNVRTDAGTGGKNTGLLADANGAGALDSADGVDDDYDGDGCTDWDELDKNFTHDYSAPASTNQRGMDPFNPNDCDQNFESSVSMSLRITKVNAIALPDDGRNSVDCTLVQVVVGTCVGSGFYVSCLGDMDHNKGTNAITLRTMCYPDNTVTKVNETTGGAGACTAASPDNRGLCGDGKAGVGPPNIWPLVSGAKESAGAQCNDRADNDGDSVMNDGCQAIAFGGIDDAHIVATGALNKGTGQMTFAGCFVGFGGSLFGPNVYASGGIDVRTGAGNMDLWPVSDANLNAQCLNGTPPGVAPVNAVVDFTELRNQKNAAGTLQPVSDDNYHRNSDRDFCTDSQELGSNPDAGGLRDPFNPYDYYDISPPGGNGTIDLFNDIFGVANLFGANAAAGPPYDIKLDRGVFLAGSHTWNLTGPDGTIDLFNDIFGVAFQFGDVC